MRASTFAAIVVLAATMFTASATAQTEPRVSISANATALTTNSTTAVLQVVWTISNPGLVDGTARLQVIAPQGWTVKVSEGTLPFALTRGSQVTRTGSISVQAGATPADGPLEATATLQDALGRSGTGRATTSLDFEKIIPLEAPPLLPAPPNRWPAFLGGAGVLALMFGGYVLQARQVGLAVEHPNQRINRGARTLYDVHVTNPSRWSRTVHLRVRQVPIAWGAALSYPRIKLQPRESIIVPLCLKVPFGSSMDAGSFLVEARPNRLSPWMVTARVEASVVDLPGWEKPLASLKTGQDPTTTDN